MSRRRPLYSLPPAEREAHAQALKRKWLTRLEPLLAELGMDATSTDVAALTERQLLGIENCVNWGRIAEYYPLATRCRAEFNARKAQQPPKPPPDPYWSLWGRLKVAHRRSEKRSEDGDYADEMSGIRGKAIEDEEAEEEYREPRTLPRRRIAVVWDGETICAEGLKDKTVKSDHHAAAYLRKLDTDESYYQECRA